MRKGKNSMCPNSSARIVRRPFPSSECVAYEVKDLGRTVRTFRNAVDIEQARWKDFRRTLRASNRNHLDKIFDYARKCADAGTMMVTPRITEVVLISTLIELLDEIEDLRRKVSTLEETKE